VTLCPEECECGVVGYCVECHSLSVNPIPLIHLTDVQELLLQRNNITLLEKDSFVSMTEVDILHIYKCGLRKIELGAFNGLTKLTELFLNGNEISELLTGTFENMSSLEYLDLRYNKIEHLDSAAFSGLGAFSGLTKLTSLLIAGNEISEILPGTFENLSSLEYLDLSDNKIEHLNSAVFSGLGAFSGLTKLTRLSIMSNNISDILPGTFENMSSLKHLDLRYNNLRLLDSAVFSGLVNLKNVDLSANKLQYLHPDAFLGSPNIKRLYIKENVALQIPTARNVIKSHSLSFLDIASCNVSSLSVETFANVSALNLLDLSDNNLRNVDINILRALPELSKLYLYGNRLECDCQLQEVWKWCEESNIQTVRWENVPECDTPSEVEGMGWSVLEKGQCLDGNIQYFGDYENTSYSDTDSGEQEYEYEYRQGYDDDEFFKRYQLPVYAIPFTLGTTCNVIILIIIIWNKDMRTVPNMVILNLAISDIIYLTVLFSEACANRLTGTWQYDGFMCMFVPFCRRMSVGLSAYSVALYSFQRYRVIVSPLQVRVSSQSKWRGIVATFCGVWTVAALFAFPSALSRTLRYEFFKVDHKTYYQNVVIFELLVSCVLPLCVIAFSYIMSARHLAESSRAISEGTQNPQLKTRRNAAKIVVGLTVVFVISYVPYHVFWTYFICSKNYIVSYNINNSFYSSNYKVRCTYLISNCFLSINPCLNPVALFCTSSHFRQHLKRYLTCFCKTSSPSTDFELARRN